MKKLVNKTINLNLVGVDGNAFNIMAAFKIQAKKEEWTEDEINLVLEEAKSKDYDHLLYTIQNHCEPIE
jgi:hypothetical protein